MTISQRPQFSPEIALKKLRPNATFSVVKTTEILDWYDPTGSEPPTWKEIEEQLLIDQAVHDEWEANRKAAEWAEIQNSLPK